jgi:hypothetical protein
MRIITFTSILACAGAWATFADTDFVPVIPDDGSGAAIRAWLLCGPFPNPPDTSGNPLSAEAPGFLEDYLQPAGGEALARPRDGMVVAYGEGHRVWELHTAPEDVIDLDAAVSRDDHVVAYAYCEIEAGMRGRRTLSLGSNNGLRVWVNGKLVFSDPAIPSLTPDGIRVPVVLEAGRNRILCKVTEATGAWQLMARILPFEPSEFARREDFSLLTDARKGPVLRHTSGNVQPAFDTALFTLWRRDDPDQTPLWQHIWSGEDELVLPAGPEYGEYRLQIETLYTGLDPVVREWGFSTGKTPDHVLFDQGRTSYRIVAGPGEDRVAAEVLKYALEKVSGALFPIVDDTMLPSPQEIVVGRNERLRQVLGDNIAILGDEAFVARTENARILIYGGSARGSLYGVFDFLERELGCRWFTSGVHLFPARDRWAFSSFSHGDAPAIRFRAVDYFDVYAAELGVPSRINSQRFRRGEQPGGLERFWFEHSFEQFVPPAEHFDDHPEYFSLVNGERRRDRSQLSLANPEVLPLLTARLLAFVEREPDYRVYNVAQNDNQNYCTCRHCAARVSREGSESGLMLAFVNAVAERVERVHPDKLVGTFAYQYTRKPPLTIRPRANVMVVLCSIECDFAHPFSHPNNAAFMDDIRGWTAITPRVFIWDYVVNYAHYLLPHPNFGVLAENLRILRDSGVQGVLEQANYQGPGGEFAELRAYVLARLLWNPDTPVRPVIEDFMTGYYGRGGPAVLRYFDLVQGLVSDDMNLTIWTRPGAPWYTRSFLEEANRLCDEAETLAENPEVLHRVQAARLPVLYLNLLTDLRGAAHRGDLEKFRAVLERGEIPLVSERTTREQMLELLDQQYEKENAAGP